MRTQRCEVQQITRWNTWVQFGVGMRMTQIWLASWGGVWKHSGALINTFAMLIGSQNRNGAKQIWTVKNRKTKPHRRKENSR